MEIYITYDAHNGRSDVKPALIEAGFRDHWMVHNKIYYLPDTSLWHQNLLNTEGANELFFTVIDNLNSDRTSDDKITIERFIAVPAEPWSGIEGKKHA